jgi:endonuclease/exonuclease/phosphatase family metal-dependent hydrolase
MSSSKFLRILSSVRGGLRPILIVAFASLAPITFSASAADEDREDGVVRVMTQNLYLGSSLEGLLNATSVPELIAAAAKVTQNIADSKPDERAAAVAREIVKNHVDLVGLQEATIVRTGPLQLPPIDLGTFLPANGVVSDGLKLLLLAFSNLGENYSVVAIVPGFDAQLPIPPPLSTPPGFDARLTTQIAILARSDLRLSNREVQGFLADRTYPTAGGPVPNPRGWASVDVEKNGRKFRFATTHLETQNPVQSPQADDLIDGAGNTTLPVVFVGDFNVTADLAAADPNCSAADPTCPVYQKFIKANFVDAWPRNRPGLTCCQAANLRNPASLLTHRLDLVLFSGAIQVLDIHLVGDKSSDRTPSGLWPSDHAGVVATLRVISKTIGRQ